MEKMTTQEKCEIGELYTPTSSLSPVINSHHWGIFVIVVFDFYSERKCPFSFPFFLFV